MKVFILVDDQKIVRCMASKEVNLHKDKLTMKKYFVECGGTVGDEYDYLTDKWVQKPANYPPPTLHENNEKLIRNKIREIAISELIGEGKLPPDYPIEEK